MKKLTKKEFNDALEILDGKLFYSEDFRLTEKGYVQRLGVGGSEADFVEVSVHSLFELASDSPRVQDNQELVAELKTKIQKSADDAYFYHQKGNDYKEGFEDGKRKIYEEWLKALSKIEKP